MAYTTIDKPSDFFNTVLFTGDVIDGDGTYHDQAVSGVGFAPDWLWHKGVTGARPHFWADKVRGNGGSPDQMLVLSSTDDNAEITTNTNGMIESLDSDGWTTTSGGDSSGRPNNANLNNEQYVGWCWGGLGTAVSGNTGGSGTAKAYSGLVNTGLGISIIKYVGNGTGGHTIPHHLGVTPTYYICKNRDTNSTDWQFYAGDPTDALALNQSDATGDSDVYWNDTAPSSTVITLGSGNTNRNTDNTVAYCFAPIQGFSSFGEYSGNGNIDGPFVFTGFKPAWIMIKRYAGATGSWLIVDNKRDPFNSGVSAHELGANVGNAQDDLSGDFKIDMLANGFKIRDDVGDANVGAQYVYLAFAENPFVTSTGVPACAR